MTLSWRIKATVVIMALSVGIGSFYCLFFTATGLSWYLNQGLKNAKGKISLHGVQYQLSGQLEINKLHYRSALLNLDFENLKLFWHPIALLSHEFAIDELIAQKLVISIPSDRQLPVSMADVKFPIPTNLAAGSIKEIALVSDSGRRLKLGGIKFEQLYLYDELFANNLTLNAADGSQLLISGHLDIRPGKVINLTTKAAIKVPVSRHFIYTNGTLVGNLSQLRFLQHIRSPYTTTLDGRIINIKTKPEFEVTANLGKSSIGELLQNMDINNLSGSLTGHGTVDDFTIHGDLTVENNGPNNDWKASITSQVKNYKAEFSISASRPNIIPASSSILTGSWDLAKRNAFPKSIVVNAKWEYIQWPLDRKTILKSKQGRFTFTGDTLESELTARGFKIDNVGTDFNEVVFKSHYANNNGILINGYATTSNGKLQFDGGLEQDNGRYHIANLNITGNNFALVRKPQAHIIVSPNLSLVRQDQSVVSKGVVKIPTANIQLQQLTHTIHLFSALIGDKQSLPSTSSDADDIVSDFDVEFGKSVWLHGYGLNANVTGDLSISSLTRNGIIADGKLNVLRGIYSDSKRKMALTGGLLKFNRDQLDNPELDLKVAGYRSRLSETGTRSITGRLQQLFKEANKDAKRRAANSKSQALVKHVAVNP